MAEELLNRAYFCGYCKTKFGSLATFKVCIYFYYSNNNHEINVFFFFSFSFYEDQILLTIYCISFYSFAFELSFHKFIILFALSTLETLLFCF